MMQIAIDFAAPPMARRSDPATSHAAADAAHALRSRHQRAILEALQANGPAGKDRLGELTGLDGVQVCRRLTELQRAGQAMPTGRTVTSAAGRAEREWKATE